VWQADVTCIEETQLTLQGHGGHFVFLKWFCWSSDSLLARAVSMYRPECVVLMKPCFVFSCKYYHDVNPSNNEGKTT
jgi:hypothetical protein